MLSAKSERFFIPSAKKYIKNWWARNWNYWKFGSFSKARVVLELKNYGKVIGKVLQGE
jgi:hypothetical protein